VSLDGAQQLLWTQEYRLGYGLQPPLVSWLLRSLFLVTGVSLAAFALFKEALLLAACVLTWRAARRLSGDAATASLAALGPLLLPQFAYEAHRDLTHTILATALVAAALDALSQAAERRRARDYLWLGLAAGLGLLAKYNVAIFLGALLAAALSLRPWRAALADRRALLSLGVLLAVLLPHGWWWLGGGFDAGLATEAQNRLGLSDEPLVVGRLRDLLHLATTALAFAGPLGLAFAWAVRGGPQPGTATPRAGQQDALRLLVRLTLVEVGVVLAATLVLGVGRHRGRWLLPLFFHLPALAALALAPRMGASGRRRLASLSVVSGIALALAALLGWALLLPVQGRWSRYHVPYAELARRIGATDVANVLAEDYWGAGCLRLRYPRAAAFGADVPSSTRPRAGRTLVVWRGGPLPPLLEGALARYGVPREAARRARVERVPYRLARSGEQEFAWFVWPPDAE
jgi:4-amino-4-deoxy-L-arabinose transferase-like glycosyltransferase